MPCIKKKLAKFVEEDKDMDIVDFLKTLTLEDFLNYPKTRDYLEEQHYLEFDYLPREKLKYMYKKMCSNAQAYFPGVLEKDYEMNEDESFVHLIFNNINLKTDITIFQDCPELARGIDTYQDSVYVEKPQEKVTTTVNVSQPKKFNWETKTYK